MPIRLSRTLMHSIYQKYATVLNFHLWLLFRQNADITPSHEIADG